jgi:hypothetical protein
MNMMSGAFAIVMVVLGCLVMMGAMAVLGRFGVRRRRDRRIGDSAQVGASTSGSDRDAPNQQARAS